MNYNFICVLAVKPSYRGFGYAILEGETSLVEWGNTVIRGEKNDTAIEKIKKLMILTRPSVLILSDGTEQVRSRRLKLLHHKIIELAKTEKVEHFIMSKQVLGRLLLNNKKATKFEIAEFIAKEFPNELAFRLPAKRVVWKSEDSRMDMFEAVALARAYKLRQADKGILPEEK